MALLETLFGIYKRLRLVITIVLSVSAFCIGLFGLAPFLTTQTFRALTAAVKGNAILSSFLDLQSMLLDDFVASTVPMFVSARRTHL